MTFDIQKILESKRRFGRRLAELPIEEKFRLLDALRERQVAISGSVETSTGGVLKEEGASYRVNPVARTRDEPTRT